MFLGPIDRSGLINCVPGLVPHLCSALARDLDWIPESHPCPAVFVSFHAPLVHAVHDVHPLVAAFDRALPGLAAEEPHGPGLIFEHVHHPVAAAACAGQPERPAGVALSVGYPAVFDSSPEELFVLSAS